MEKKKAQSLTIDELTDLYSLSEPGNLVFDLSKIPSKDFEPILISLIKYGRTKIAKISFTLDLYNQVSRPTENSTVSKKDLSILSNSAFKRNSKTIKSVILALSHILPKTESLVFLGFRSFKFTQDQLSEIISIIRKCNTLQDIWFENIPMYDSGFEQVINAVKKPGILSFHCISCGLSDSSIGNIKDLLNYHLNLQKEADWKASFDNQDDVEVICLTYLDLRGNSLSYRAIVQIGEIIGELPSLFLDLRGNKIEEGKMVSNIRKNFPQLELLVDFPPDMEDPNAPEQIVAINDTTSPSKTYQISTSTSSPHKSSSLLKSKETHSPQKYENQNIDAYENDINYEYEEPLAPRSQPTFQQTSYAPQDIEEFYEDHPEEAGVPIYDDGAYPPFPQAQFNAEDMQQSPVSASGRQRPNEEIFYRDPYSETHPEAEFSFPEPFRFEGTSSGEVEEVLLAPDLKVVGRRAREFAAYIQTLGVLLGKLQSQQGEEEKPRAESPKKVKRSPRKKAHVSHKKRVK